MVWDTVQRHLMPLLIAIEEEIAVAGIAEITSGPEP